MSIHNLQGALELQELGFKRVVLSRELSIEEIEYITNNCNIEIECFIHGALCISYSVNVYFLALLVAVLEIEELAPKDVDFLRINRK